MSWFPRKLSSNNEVRMNSGVDLPEVVIGLYSIAPALGGAELIRASLSLTGATQTKTTGNTDPDVPRQILFTKNANGTVGNMVIVGTDINDAALTETLALDPGATTTVTLNAFKTITSLTFPAQTAPGDWIKTGTNAVLGSPEYAAYDNILWCTFDGAYNAHSISNHATVVSKNLVTITAATFDGAKIVKMYVITS